MKKRTLKKINLKPYKVLTALQNEAIVKMLSTSGILEILEKSSLWTPMEIAALKRGKMKQSFDIKQSIRGVLLNEAGINGTEFCSRLSLSDKIKKADDSIILNDKEYEKIEQACRNYTQWRMNYAEFSKRIFEAEDVKVKEDKPG